MERVYWMLVNLLNQILFNILTKVILRKPQCLKGRVNFNQILLLYWAYKLVTFILNTNNFILNIRNNSFCYCTICYTYKITTNSSWIVQLYHLNFSYCIILLIIDYYWPWFIHYFTESLQGLPFHTATMINYIPSLWWQFFVYFVFLELFMVAIVLGNNCLIYLLICSTYGKWCAFGHNIFLNPSMWKCRL